MNTSKSRRLAALAALICGAMPVPAGAATIVATYTGKIKFGFDASGVFGRANTSLNDTAAIFTFTFDTETPGAELIVLPPSYTDLRSSGPPAAGVGTITIRGQSASIAGTTESSARQINDYTVPGSPTPFDQVLHSVLAPDLNGTGFAGTVANRIQVSVRGPGVVTTSSNLSPLEYDVTEGDVGVGSFQFQQTHPDLPTFKYVSASGSFFVDHVSIAVLGLPPPSPAPVPEPAAWALMILGFAATGAALRRRARPDVACG